MPKGVFELILQSEAGEKYDLRRAFATPADLVVPENWAEEHKEGRLAVDVAETGKEIIAVSTVAGADTDKIEVYIHNDLLTIRGTRVTPVPAGANHFHNECYWGKFSRTIVLPVEVKADLASAEFKNGVLIIRIPKQRTEARVPVVIVDD